jgi:uncharacterized damage-inducible protein DinB
MRAVVDLQDVKTLIDYHYWARDRLIEALEPLTPDVYARDLGGSFGSIRATAAHIYVAEWAWHERWHGRSPTAPLPLDRVGDVATLARNWRALEASVRAFVDRMSAEDLGRIMRYTLLSGQPGESAFWQMVQHVVNHASYHRGQITSMLRQVGAVPPQSMDLIVFYRTREAR